MTTYEITLNKENVGPKHDYYVVLEVRAYNLEDAHNFAKDRYGDLVLMVEAKLP